MQRRLATGRCRWGTDSHRPARIVLASLGRNLEWNSIRTSLGDFHVASLLPGLGHLCVHPWGPVPGGRFVRNGQRRAAPRPKRQPRYSVQLPWLPRLKTTSRQSGRPGRCSRPGPWSSLFADAEPSRNVGSAGPVEPMRVTRSAASSSREPAGPTRTPARSPGSPPAPSSPPGRSGIAADPRRRSCRFGPRAAARRSNR